MSSRAISRNASKRTIGSGSEDEGSQRPTKKAKEVANPNLNGQPTNVSLPAKLVFEPKKPGTLRISTWNIVSLKSASAKGFHRYVEAEDADILVLCETKVNAEPVDPLLNARYPYRYWSISDEKGYAGTAILSKHEPISVVKTLPNHPNGDKVGNGRIVILEFAKCYLVGTYVPNAGRGLVRLGYKKLWNQIFETYVRGLDAVKPVIWAGDLNVAPTEMDLINAKQNWNKSAGYTQAETTWYKGFLDPPTSKSSVGTRTQMKIGVAAHNAVSAAKKILEKVPNALDSSSGSTEEETPVTRSPSPTSIVEPMNRFIDVWRERHPDLRHYTYFNFRHQARLKNNGWRLDMFVLSERLLDQVQLCEIRDEVWGPSDHCPLVLEINQEAVV